MDSPDNPATAEPTETRGVSALLQGDKTVIVPEGSDRMARRQKRAVADGAFSGCGGEEPPAEAPPAEEAPRLIPLGIRNGKAKKSRSRSFAE